MNILKYPEDQDILRQKSVAVSKVDDDLIGFAQNMVTVMIDAGGVGISAPQVGLPIRVIAILIDGKPVVMFNPTVLKASPDKQKDAEGCLSFPGQFIEISRPTEIHVKYRNINNKMEYRVLSGIEARAVIHEIEHLNGKLLIDHEK